MQRGRLGTSQELLLQTAKRSDMGGAELLGALLQTARIGVFRLWKFQI